MHTQGEDFRYHMSKIISGWHRVGKELAHRSRKCSQWRSHADDGPRYRQRGAQSLCFARRSPFINVANPLLLSDRSDTINCRKSERLSALSMHGIQVPQTRAGYTQNTRIAVSPHGVGRSVRRHTNFATARD